MANSYLYDLADSILTLATSYISVDRTGNKKPDRIFVSYGTPVADSCCDQGGQLTVHLAAFNTDGNAIEHDTNKCLVRRHARFLITLYRCHPTQLGKTIPTQKKLDDAALCLYKDLWALENGITDGWQNIVASPCDNVELGPVRLLDPEGGCAGFSVEVIVELDDTTPMDALP